MPLVHVAPWSVEWRTSPLSPTTTSELPERITPFKSRDVPESRSVQLASPGGLTKITPSSPTTMAKPSSPSQPARSDPLQTGAKHFSLMSHWFYNMIGFGRAAQIQEGNENVV